LENGDTLHHVRLEDLVRQFWEVENLDSGVIMASKEDTRRIRVVTARQGAVGEEESFENKVGEEGSLETKDTEQDSMDPQERRLGGQI